MAYIGEMLSNVSKRKIVESSPSLQVHASVHVPEKGLESMSKYDKEELKRLKKEIAGIEEALEEWVPEDVAARAKRSLELELQAKKARLLECKIRIKQHEPEPEEEESEEDE